MHRPVYCHWLAGGVAAGGLLLAACQQRPARLAEAPAVAPAPAPAPPPAARPDSVAARAAFVPYTTTRLVAPGLRVDVQALPTTEPVGDSTDLRLVLTVRQQGRVLYRDTTADGWAYSHYAGPQTARLYPLWVPTGDGDGQLLLAYNNRPDKELVRRLFVVGARVVRCDTLPAFDGPARDLDHDGRPEYAGAFSFSEVASDGHGHLGSTYDPVLYYEQRPTGLVLDSALTERQARARYGGFYGFASRATFVPPDQPGAPQAHDN